MAGPHRTAHVRHRDRMLARTRRLTLWVTSGAIAAAAGLGVEFAHELPGHASPAAAAARPAITPSQQVRAHRHPAASGHAKQAATHRKRAHNQHHSTHLTKPTKAPASTPAPPVVTSGGT